MLERAGKTRAHGNHFHEIENYSNDVDCRVRGAVARQRVGIFEFSVIE